MSSDNVARMLDMLKTGLGAYLSIEAKKIADIVGKQEEIIRKVIERELMNLPPRYRLIDFDTDVGEYTEGTIVDLESEGIPICPGYGSSEEYCWQIHGYFSGKALKVTIPAGGTKTLIVGSSPIFRPERAFLAEIIFYLQSGLSGYVTWAIGSTKNVAEESTAFRVSFEGKDNWNAYVRTLPQEYFQTKNWFLLNLTNTSDTDKAVYIGRIQFAELPENLGYSEDLVIGYIPVTETLLTTKLYMFGDYAGWMGMKSRFFGVTHTLNVQSDGVNTLNTQIVWQYKSVNNVVDSYSYTGATRSDSRFIEFIADKRCFRGNDIRLKAYMTGGKGYIRRFRVQLYLNEQAPPEYPKYLGGTYTTDGNGTEDSVTLLNYLTTPLALKYAKIKAVELSVGGTNGYAYLVIDGNTATEKVNSGSTKVIEDLGEAEQIILKANDPGGGTTIPVTYKIYYKEVKALLVR